MEYTVWAQHFIYEEIDPSICGVPLREWRRIHDERPTATRIFAKVTVATKEIYVALGAPVIAEMIPDSEHEAVFLPLWVLDMLGMTGSGETVTIEWLDSEHFPNATRIVLRPHDSAFYHADAKEELERVLTTMGVLQLGATIHVPVSSLGGFVITFDVVGLEPAELVLMEGDEVTIEFEGAIDEAPITVPPPSPEPFVPLEPMLPQGPVVNDGGYTLGGTRRPRGWNRWRE